MHSSSRWSRATLAAAFALGLITTTRSCGISVHSEVTHRANLLFQPAETSPAVTYKRYIDKYPAYVQAGSFFPDWGFSCLGYNVQSEDAHWAPFVRAAVEHIRETYPRPWLNERVQGLIAFIFAVVSHGTADIAWHSLMGISDGFIVELAALDQHFSYELAHEIADTGGDFTLRHSATLPYLVPNWRIPVNDIVKVYERLYSNGGKYVPPASAIQSCMTAAFAASQADQRLGQYLFGYYGTKSPFLIREMEDYYRGGLNDMSARVSFCWSPLAQWFERGPGIDPLCASYMDVVSDGDHSARLNTSASDHQRYMLEHGRNILREEGYEIVSLLREDDGVLEIGLEEVEPVYNRETRELDEYRRWIRERDPLLLGDHETRDQKLALAIQSSSTSYDQLKPSCRRVDDLSVASSAPTLILQYPSASLGHAITAGDFTGDGIPRLAISAPYYTTSPYSPHSGVVFILPSLNYTVAGTIDILTLASYVLTPPTIVSAAAAQSRFGWSMVIVDLNHDGIDDLAVAAPFAGGDRGSVYVYFGRKGEGLSKQPDVVIEGEGPGVVEGFGTVLVGADVDGDGFADLIVACPLCGGEEGVKHSGTIRLFLTTRNYTTTPLHLTHADHIFSSPALKPYEHFGSAIEIVDHPDHGRLILVGAPGYATSEVQGVGRVYGFRVRAEDEKVEVEKVLDLSGTNQYMRFGSQIIAGQLLGDGRTLMAVSSPSEETHTILNVNHWQAGAVRLIDLSRLYHGATLEDDDLRMGAGLVATVNGSAAAAHLGRMITQSAGNTKTLWLGEPMAEAERGRVYRWDLKRVTRAEATANVEVEADCYRSNEKLARFGSKLWSGDLNGDGKDDLVVTSEHSGLGARLSGNVKLIIG